MANPHNVELEARKFLHKLIQESKDEPTKLATKLYVILQHMRSIGKENSMPYQVISRAMETVIKQHGLDIEALMSSRLPLAAGAQVEEPGSSQVAGSSQRSGVTKDPKASLAGMEMSKADSYASGMSLVGPGNGVHDIYQGSPSNMMVSKALHGEGEQSAIISTRTYVMAQNNVTAEQNAGAAPPSRIMQPSSSYPKAVMVVDGINKENNFRVEQDDANCSRKKGIVRTLDEEYHISRDVLEKYSAKKLEEVADILGVSRSTLKRICRKHNIFRWPPCKAKKRKFTVAHQEFLQSTDGNIEDSRLKKQSFSYLPQKQDLATKANKAPDAIVHDVSSIIVKATYRDDIIKFHLSLSSRKTDLEEEVSKRLNLSVGSFKIKYLDEDNDWVLVTCDADLRSCITILRSLGNTTIRMLVSQLPNDNSNLWSNLSLVI